MLFSVGHWLILEVCKQLQSWKNENPAQLVTVSVNLSAQQFIDSRFVTELQRGPPPEWNRAVAVPIPSWS